MRHILVVDDEPAICDVVQMGLELDGTCRVTRALCADAALDVALHDRPEAAIIDAVLPNVSGLALARAVIDLDIPVLITSGEPEHQRQLTEAGCSFLPKPFSLSRLLVETRVLLDAASERQARLAANLDGIFRARRELAKVVEQTRRVVAEARRVVERARSDHAVIEQSPLQQANGRAALLDGVLSEAMMVTGADMGNVQLADATGALRIVASRGFGPAFLSYFGVVPASSESACGAALGQGRRIVVPDVTASEIFAGKRSGDVLREAGVRAVQSTPLFGRDGRVLGMISTHRHSVWTPSDVELIRLDPIVRRAAHIIQPVC